MAMPSHALVRVMVVVPAFAPSQEADPPQVLAVVGGFVVAVSPHVRSGVNGPGNVIDPNHSDEHAPDDKRPGGMSIPENVADGPHDTAQHEEPDEKSFIEE